MTVPASPALEPVEGDLRELRQSFQEPAEPQKPSFEKNLPQELIICIEIFLPVSGFEPTISRSSAKGREGK